MCFLFDVGMQNPHLDNLISFSVLLKKQKKNRTVNVSVPVLLSLSNHKKHPKSQFYHPDGEFRVKFEGMKCRLCHEVKITVCISVHVHLHSSCPVLKREGTTVPV